MLSKRQRLKDKRKADSLLCTDASEAQGWLIEGGDNHALHPAMGIPYDVIGEAMETQEQLQPRRSTRLVHDTGALFLLLPSLAQADWVSTASPRLLCCLPQQPLPPPLLEEKLLQ
ncbi:hypothetical protein BRADI_4g10682v3, partial [Brachypodium distachyon]